MFLKNLGNVENFILPGWQVGAKRLMGGMGVHEFPGILNISPGQTVSVTLGIDYRWVQIIQYFLLALECGGASPKILICVAPLT